MKKLVYHILLILILGKSTFAQSLVWLPIYETETKSAGQNIQLYKEFNLKFNSDSPSYISLFSRRGNKPLLSVSRSATFEVFDRRVLVISVKTYSKWENGEPNFLKPRDTLYFIDLKRRKARKNILWTNLEGKKVLSNAIELTNLNKSRNYDYALRNFSFSGRDITFLSLDSMKFIKINLQRLK